MKTITVFTREKNSDNGEVYVHRYARTLNDDDTDPYGTPCYEATGIYGPLLGDDRRDADIIFPPYGPTEQAWDWAQGWVILGSSED